MDKSALLNSLTSTKVLDIDAEHFLQTVDKNTAQMEEKTVTFLTFLRILEVPFKAVEAIRPLSFPNAKIKIPSSKEICSTDEGEMRA